MHTLYVQCTSATTLAINVYIHVVNADYDVTVSDLRFQKGMDLLISLIPFPSWASISLHSGHYQHQQLVSLQEEIHLFLHLNITSVENGTFSHHGDLADCFSMRASSNRILCLRSLYSAYSAAITTRSLCVTLRSYCSSNCREKIKCLVIICEESLRSSGNG